MSEDALLGWRSEFPTLATSVHLIGHSLGPLPRRARAYANEFFDRWEQDSIGAWSSWIPFATELANVVAGVIGVAPGTVTLAQNVSTLSSTVASALDFSRRRNRVVYSEQDFSTCHYVWSETARRGAEVVVVSSPDRLVDAIDERTLIVPISHVLFRSSALIDPRAIIEKAHRVGALVFLDVYQSAGTVPLALSAWDVDLACGGSVKWVCGGPGASLSSISPKRAGVTSRSDHERARPSPTTRIDHRLFARSNRTAASADEA